MFVDVESVDRFIHGGSAILTVQSKKTGKHFTYRFNKADDSDVTFVMVLTGPDNTSDYTYVGLLANDRVRLTKKSKFTCEATSYRAINYVLGNLAKGNMPADTVIHHEGRCAVCTRKLTEPLSLEIGIGPECRSKMGIAN